MSKLCSKCGRNPTAGEFKSLCYGCRDQLDGEVAGRFGITKTELKQEVA